MVDRNPHENKLLARLDRHRVRTPLQPTPRRVLATHDPRHLAANRPVAVTTVHATGANNVADGNRITAAGIVAQALATAVEKADAEPVAAA